MATYKTTMSALALVCAAFPASAADEVQSLQQLSCTFTTECIDTEACEATDYAMSVDYRATPEAAEMDPFTVFVSDLSGDFKAAPITDGTPGAPLTGFVAFNGDATQRLMTIADGRARYSIHMRQEDMALYYEGSCEVTEQ
ncbi:hypothetical protein [Celeribacter arenosi]|uniref:Uncharacterized protein n=1 Tax=Celeribacter arenosi TaxID=792649 RepID=A0ABP7KFJ2_9RHOB